MAREKHLNAAARKEESQKRRKRRNILLLIMIVLMVTAVFAEAITLKNMTTVDRRFVREVERGVIEGWTNSRGDLQMKESGAITDTAFINTELEAVEEFKNKAYQDKNLKKIANRYMGDLKACKSATLAHDPVTDSDAFWEEFGTPYADRLLVLKELYTGDYKMGNSWDKYPDQRDEVLFKGWLAETASGLKFVREKGKEGTDVFKAELQNDSGFDLEYISLDVGIYDSSGSLYGNAEVYKEDIKNGSRAELVFYFSGNKVKSYCVNGADGVAVPIPDEEEQNSGNAAETQDTTEDAPDIQE